MRLLLTLSLTLLLGLAACTTTSDPGSDDAGREDGTIEGTGTVEYLDFEGGFYGIIADDGAQYDPVDLPEAFQEDGLRVRFTLEEAAQQASIHMWGTRVRVLDIERL